MAKPGKEVSPDDLLNKLKRYSEEAQSESERAERVDSYYSNSAPSSVDELMKRLRENGFLSKLDSEDGKREKIRTEYSADEDGEFSEKNFFVEHTEDAEEEIIAIDEPAIDIEESLPAIVDKPQKQRFVKSVLLGGKRFALKRIIPTIVEEEIVSDDTDDNETCSSEGYTENGEASYDLLDFFGFEENENVIVDDLLENIPEDGIEESFDGKYEYEMLDSLELSDNSSDAAADEEVSQRSLSTEQDIGDRERIDWSEAAEITVEEYDYIETEPEPEPYEDDSFDDPMIFGTPVDDNNGYVGDEHEEIPEEGDIRAHNEINDQMVVTNVKKERDTAYADEYSGEFASGNKSEGMEYTAQGQETKIKRRLSARYREKRREASRYLLAAMIAFLLEVVLIPLILVGGKQAYNLPCTLISLFWMLAVIYFARADISCGFKALLSGQTNVWTSVIMLLFPSAICYITSIISLGKGVYLSLPFALCLAMYKGCELLFIKKQTVSFNVVSDRGAKYVLSKMSFAQRKPEERIYRSYVASDRYFCVKKTEFAEDFFSRSAKQNKIGASFYITLIVSAIISVGLFVVELRSDGGNAVEALFVLCICAWMTLPIGLEASYDILSFFASLRCAKKRSALLGEHAFDEYSKGGVICFTDKEIISEKNIKIKNLKVFGEMPFESALTLSYAIMKEIASPIAPVLKRALDDKTDLPEVNITSVYDDGVDGNIAGVRILAGSPDFVSKIGLVNLHASLISRKYRQMCIVVGSKIVALLDIEYTVDEALVKNVSYLYGDGVYISVRSLDPNLTSEFMTEALGGGVIPIRVVKKKDDVGISLVRKSASSSLVALDRAKSVLYALSICDKTAYAKKLSGIFGIASVIMGAVIVAAAMVVNTGVPSFVGLLISMYHLFWVIPGVIMAILYVK